MQLSEATIPRIVQVCAVGSRSSTSATASLSQICPTVAPQCQRGHGFAGSEWMRDRLDSERSRHPSSCSSSSVSPVRLAGRRTARAAAFAGRRSPCRPHPIPELRRRPGDSRRRRSRLRRGLIPIPTARSRAASCSGTASASARCSRSAGCPSMCRRPSSSRAWRPAGFGRRFAGAASSTCWRTSTATSSACGTGGRSTCSPSRGWASRSTASPGRSRRRTWRCSSPCPTSRSRPSRGSSSRRRSPSGPASSSASSTPSTAIGRGS